MHAPSGTIPIAPTNGIGGAVQMTRPKLPAIPIPNFSGKVWEYSNFWTLFRANFHDQPLTKLQKFNYTLSALPGEARVVVKRYHVTEDSYDCAVELLQKKYGDNTKLIASLQTRLENARAERSTIQGQSRLLEYIIPIITQLEKLSINLDGSYLAQKTLANFTPSIQRQVLACRLPKSTSDSDWRMQDIINTLDDLITTEERIQEMIDKTVHHDTHSNLRDPPSLRLTHKIPLCMFCRSDKHKSSSCAQYSTISARRIFMQERKLCLNCGRQGHFVTQCMSKGCRTCNGKKHHHTLCPQRTFRSQEGTYPKAYIPPKVPGKPPPTTIATRSLPRPRTRLPEPGTDTPRTVRAHPVQSENVSEQGNEAEPILGPSPQQYSVVLHHKRKTSTDGISIGRLIQQASANLLEPRTPNKRKSMRKFRNFLIKPSSAARMVTMSDCPTRTIMNL
ncbi:zinc knuckle [Ancylostoma duodenale]|uniref:Zinc knuckle n=1 Tax=Ancylostoma duodenale TaxID=51022 RepID=A0A0C2FEZ2_9BILA|nr:zinc knuckle [Ancylostoma duodenale]